MNSTSSALVRTAVIVVAMIAGTVLLGWAGVAVVAAICGLTGRWHGVRARTVALAAAGAWAAILAWQAMLAPVGALAGLLGDVLGVPAVAPVLLTVLLPFAIAWPPAYLGGELVRLLVPRSAAGPPAPLPAAERSNREPTSIH